MSDTETIRDAGHIIAALRRENRILRGQLLEVATMLDRYPPPGERAEKAAEIRAVVRDLDDKRPSPFSTPVRA